MTEKRQRPKDDPNPEPFRWHVKSDPQWRGPKSEGSSTTSPTSDGTPGLQISSGIELYEVLGHGGSSKEQDHDRSYGAFMLVEGKGEALVAELDPDALSADVWLIRAEMEAHGAHARADVLEHYGVVPLQGAYEDVEFHSPGPFAVRTGDVTLHGNPLSSVGGSPDVLVGGRPAWRGCMDYHTCPLSTAGAPHNGGTVFGGDLTVLINGMPAVRCGDFLLEAPGGPNTIVSGATDVLIGVTPPPVTAKAPIPEEPRTGIWKYLDADIRTTLGYAKSEAGIGGSVDLGKGEAGAKAKGGIFGAILRISGEGEIRIPLGDTWSITIGVQAEASALTAGAEAGGGVSWGQEDSDGKKRWGVDEVGGRAGAGWFGGGLKISAGLEKS